MRPSTCIALLFTTIFGLAHAQTVPSSFNFQSKLYAPSGSPYTTPQGQATDVTFKLYTSETGAGDVYQKKINIVINGGIVESTIDDQAGYPSINDLVKQNGTLFLGVQVGTDAELKPRMKLHSTPFAGHANYSSTAGVAEDVPLKNINPASITINGLQVLDAAGNVNAATLGVNGNMLFDSAGQWIGTGELNGWEVQGANVVAAKTVKCLLTCSMQHCEVRQLGGLPAIHFHNDGAGTSSYDARIALLSDDVLATKGASLRVDQDLTIYNTTASPSLRFSTTADGGTYDAIFTYSEDGNGPPFNTVIPRIRLAQGPVLASSFMHVQGSNQVGIDFTTDAPDEPAPFASDDPFDARLQLTSDDALSIKGASLFIENGCIVATNITCPSDERLKKNISPLSDSAALIDSLRGVSFEWLDARRESSAPAHSGGPRLGFVAQEVQRVLPFAVQTMPDGYLALDTQQIIPVLVEAFKEQSRRHAEEIEASRTELATQAGRIKELESQIARIAERLADLEPR